MSITEIDRLNSLITDPGLDAFELSTLYWLHAKCKVYRDNAKELDKTEYAKYAELKTRFVNNGTAKELAQPDSKAFGLTARDVDLLVELNNKIQESVATADEIEEARRLNNRQVDYGLNEIIGKGVHLFQDDTGTTMSGFDDDDLIRLAELSFENQYGVTGLTVTERKEMGLKISLLNDMEYIGNRIRDMKRLDWNRSIVALAYDITMTGPPPLPGGTPSPAKLLTPIPTIDKSQIPHFPKLSDSAAKMPPLPMAKRPMEEQNLLRNLATATGMNIEDLMKAFTLTAMRAATTVITDREVKSKILVMETDYLSAPKLGNTSMLTRQHEDYIKARFGKLYFENHNKQSHPLKYILELHCKVSEAWQLDNECSIDLLTRCLRGDAFRRIHHYLKLERSITRCYQVLQSIYSDELSPAEAQAQLDKYIRNPSAHDPPHNTLEEVFLHIHLLCSRIHSLEIEPAKTQNTLSSVFSTVRWYLTSNFVEREVKQLYQDFDTYMNDYPEDAVTSEAFFILKSMAKNKFLATPPRHLIARSNPSPPTGGFNSKKITQSLRPMGRLEEMQKTTSTNMGSMRGMGMDSSAKVEEIQSRESLSAENVEKDPYEESENEDEDTEQSLAQAFVDANPEECMYMGEQEEDASNEPNVPEEEVLEISKPVDFTKMKFSENIRCRLCACNQTEGHTPPFFRSCTFFRGQIPQKIQQKCCNGFHSALAHGTICPVVKVMGQRPYMPIYNKPFFKRTGAKPRTQPQQQQYGQGPRGPVVAQRPQFQQKKQVF